MQIFASPNVDVDMRWETGDISERSAHDITRTFTTVGGILAMIYLTQWVKKSLRAIGLGMQLLQLGNLRKLRQHFVYCSSSNLQVPTQLTAPSLNYDWQSPT